MIATKPSATDRYSGPRFPIAHLRDGDRPRALCGTVLRRDAPPAPGHAETCIVCADLYWLTAGALNDLDPGGQTRVEGKVSDHGAQRPD
jgi:hypothetical protein